MKPSVFTSYADKVRSKSKREILLDTVAAAVIAGLAVLYVSPLYDFAVWVWLALFAVAFASNLLILLQYRSFRTTVFWFCKLIGMLFFLLYLIMGIDYCAGDFARKGNDMISPAPGRFLVLWPLLWAVPLLLLLASYAFMKALEAKSRFVRTIEEWALFYTPFIPGITRMRGKTDKKNFHPVLSSILFFIALLFLAATLYLRNYFPDMDVEAIMFNVKFANGAFNRHIFLTVAIYLACVTGLSAAFFIMMFRRARTQNIDFTSFDENESRTLDIAGMNKKGLLTLPLLFTAVCFVLFGQQIDLPGYADGLIHETSLYSDYYVEPSPDVYSFPEHRKNLIYIYLESIENTFTSYARGGNQPVDYIPELTDLAEANINFSNTDAVGGQSVFFSTVDYTMGSTVAQTSGIPLMLYNSERDIEADYNSIRRLEDILHEAGYNQIFIRGEDTAFARYEEYAGRYENSTIFDYKEALRRGWLPEGYKETWGYEDLKLFEFAKTLITDIASEGEPFCATLYTVDTHGLEGGYRCPMCDSGIKNDFAAAVNCTSAKIESFVEWLKLQDYYDDTVIIIVGDHPVEGNRSNKTLNLEENGYCRTTYNCIINSDTVPVNEKNRLFTAMDMFPTTLSALGVEIKGNRLGLGTNLFSDEQTLCELLGEDTFTKEIKRHSKFYKTVITD